MNIEYLNRNLKSCGFFLDYDLNVMSEAQGIFTVCTRCFAANRLARPTIRSKKKADNILRQVQCIAFQVSLKL